MEQQTDRSVDQQTDGLMDEQSLLKSCESATNKAGYTAIQSRTVEQEQ